MFTYYHHIYIYVSSSIIHDTATDASSSTDLIHSGVSSLKYISRERERENITYFVMYYKIHIIQIHKNLDIFYNIFDSSLIILYFILYFVL